MNRIADAKTSWQRVCCVFWFVFMFVHFCRRSRVRSLTVAALRSMRINSDISIWAPGDDRDVVAVGVVAAVAVAVVVVSAGLCSIADTFSLIVSDGVVVVAVAFAVVAVVGVPLAFF